MFRFLKIKRPDTCPVQEEIRIWLEGAFLQLLDFFGKEKTIHRKVLIPHFSDFPIQYNGSEQSAIKTLEIIATHMEIPIESIHLEFYDGGINEIKEDTRRSIFVWEHGLCIKNKTFLFVSSF
jgi:hypothetical protein